MAFQRSDGVWIERVEIPGPTGAMRYRVPVYGDSHATVTARAESFRQSPAFARLAEIRAAGSHTRREWGDLLRSLPSPRQHWTFCSYCGRELHNRLATRDHKTPLARGGSDTIDNIAPACRRCNSAKGVLTAEEFETVRA